MPPSTDCSAARSCGGCRSKVAGGLARTGAPGHRSSTIAIAPPPRSAEPGSVDVVDTCSVYPGAPTGPGVCEESGPRAALPDCRAKPGRPSMCPFTALRLLTVSDIQLPVGIRRPPVEQADPNRRPRPGATQSSAVHNPWTPCG